MKLLPTDHCGGVHLAQDSGCGAQPGMCHGGHAFPVTVAVAVAVDVPLADAGGHLGLVVIVIVGVSASTHCQARPHHGHGAHQVFAEQKQEQNSICSKLFLPQVFYLIMLAICNKYRGKELY